MSSATTERTLSFAEALFEATTQEMERDPGVFVYGLGVDDIKGMYGTTLDLHNRFGEDRNFDTPLSEDAMTGFAVGAALAGMRPIHVHQRVDFLMLCMNQLVNCASKYSYMFGGEVCVPMVVRAIIGRSWGQGAQHSQALHSMLMHVPGIKVAAPTTPHDAKGCMTAAIRDNNPVVFIEHRMLYNFRGIVPEEPYEIPFGQARKLIEGDDITIVAISHMVTEALRASHALAEAGIRAEIIDPVTLTPIDIDTISASVDRTGRLLVVDNAWTMCGASAEIMAQVVERLQERSSPVRMGRMGFAPVPCPTTRPLEELFYPHAGSIAETAYKMIRGESGWTPQLTTAQEIDEFRGPF